MQSVVVLQSIDRNSISHIADFLDISDVLTLAKTSRAMRSNVNFLPWYCQGRACPQEDGDSLFRLCLAYCHRCQDYGCAICVKECDVCKIEYCKWCGKVEHCQGDCNHSICQKGRCVKKAGNDCISTVTCENCEKRRCDDSGLNNECYGCKVKYCHDCSALSSCNKGCGEWLCTDCDSEACFECAGAICVGCPDTVWCKKCGTRSCAACKHISVCSDCGEQVYKEDFYIYTCGTCLADFCFEWRDYVVPREGPDGKEEVRQCDKCSNISTSKPAL